MLRLLADIDPPPLPKDDASFCQLVVANSRTVATFMEQPRRKSPRLSPPEANLSPSTADGGQKDTEQILENTTPAASDTLPEGTGTTDRPTSQDSSAGRHSKASLPKSDEGGTRGQLDGTSGGYQEGASDDASHVSVSDGMARAAIVDWETEDDLTNQVISLADESLLEVYGDTVHRNGGQHLHGGIRDDVDWQDLHEAVVGYDHLMYEPPMCRVGARFVSLLAKEWKGVRERRWNAERPLIFPAAILCKSPSITKAQDIKPRLMKRMDLWEAGHQLAIIQDCVEEAHRRIRGCRDQTFEAKARRYNDLALNGKLRAAIRGITERDGGGVLLPEDRCTKDDSKTVREVLEAKHPALRVPDLADPDCLCFEEYPDGVPAAMPVNVSSDAVTKMAPHLSGGAGPSGVDANMLRLWLTRFNRASGELREEMAYWQDWLANHSPPWAAYRAVMARRLVALDKQPGVRPVGIGEIWQRLLAKLVIADCGDQAKLACGAVQLCAGLEAGIEGALHSVRHRAMDRNNTFFADLDTCSDDTPHPSSPSPTTSSVTTPTRNPPGVHSHNTCDSTCPAEDDDLPTDAFTMVDARNGFNELSRLAMLWTVRHRWPKGSRFSFNCYRHEAKLFLRDPGKPVHILMSREGVTQGDPLSMFLYGIALTPMAEHLRAFSPSVLQPWYADDTALMGSHENNAKCLAALKAAGPWFGYFPEPEKSFHICPAEEEEAARNAFEAMGLSVRFSRGQRYVGGFVGARERLREWLGPMVREWVAAIHTLAAVAKRYPQTAYVGLVASLQGEWQYVSRVIPHISNDLQPIEDAIRTVFIPALFGGKPVRVTDEFRQLLGNSVKKAGLGIRNAVASADRLFEASEAATALLVDSLLNGTDLGIESHRQCVRSAAAKMRKERLEEESCFLLERTKRSKAERAKLESAAESGAWLTAMPRRINGTEMSMDEFRDALRLRYDLTPLSLEPVCDGCGEKFTVQHAMSCKKGGLVSRRHEAGKQEWIALSQLAFGRSRVVDEPYIFHGRDVPCPAGATAAAISSGKNGRQAESDSRGDISVDGFWKSSATCVFDVRITDVKAPSYRGASPLSVLKRHEREKKKMYLEPCLERRRHFTPLVYSAEGMPGRETRAAEKRLASALADKLDRSYSEMVGWVRQRMAMAVVRQVTVLLRGSRAPRLFGVKPMVSDTASFNDVDHSHEW